MLAMTSRVEKLTLLLIGATGAPWCTILHLVTNQQLFTQYVACWLNAPVVDEWMAATNFHYNQPCDNQSSGSSEIGGEIIAVWTSSWIITVQSHGSQTSQCTIYTCIYTYSDNPRAAGCLHIDKSLGQASYVRYENYILREQTVGLSAGRRMIL